MKTRKPFMGETKAILNLRKEGTIRSSAQPLGQSVQQFGKS